MPAQKPEVVRDVFFHRLHQVVAHLSVAVHDEQLHQREDIAEEGGKSFNSRAGSA
jgi:hypothetical protein